jgi:hypothetical protein
VFEVRIPKVINKSRFYDIERKEFRQERGTFLTDCEAKRFARKITKHFKSEQVTLKFHGGRNGSGNADWDNNIVRVGHDPSVMVLAHELAHIVTRSGHTKRGLACMERIILFARAKNYWKVA